MVLIAFVIDAWRRGAAIDIAKLGPGLANISAFLGEAWPPDTSRLFPITMALIATLEMALAGTLLGIFLSLPLGLAAARNMTPNSVFYYLSRVVVSVSRTIPDLVWGLIFVVAVGLGPTAGVLALAIDTIGLCGRFFAEAFEEADPGPMTALKASGCSPLAVVIGGLIPTALPSIIATSMFCLEQAVRSAVVLGVVGAGGIGIELSVSMTLLRYDEALTIIGCIFIFVWTVERISAALRRRVLGAGGRLVGGSA